INLEPHQLGREVWEPFRPPLRRSKLKHDARRGHALLLVPRPRLQSLYITQLAKFPPERVDTRIPERTSLRQKDPNSVHLPRVMLLRLARDRGENETDRQNDREPDPHAHLLGMAPGSLTDLNYGRLAAPLPRQAHSPTVSPADS